MRRLLIPLFLVAPAAQAKEPVALPSQTGQTGLLSMPDARFAPDGTWRAGYGYLKPYPALWSSLTAMPWLEGSFRYTRIMHVPGFPDRPDADYGDYKDKSFDLKLRLLPERGWWPQIAVGAQDAGGGTGLFSAYYAVASKRVGDFDFTLGYGDRRIDGAYGGVRWQPSMLGNWSVVAEYDAYDYPNDRFAAQSGAANYRKEAALGLEYRSQWWGAKAFAAHGEGGVNAWVTLPLGEKEFIPKVDEPAPYTKINPRPTQAQWRADAAHQARLVNALRAQDFHGIETGYENGRLWARLANTRIASMPRAIGRAARTMLSFAPLEVRELEVTYLQGPLPVATYSFAHAPTLQRYFNGMTSRAHLAPTVQIAYAQPGGRSPDADRDAALAAFEEPLPAGLVLDREIPQLFGLKGENVLGGRLRIRPGLSTFFNDPSGALKADLSALVTWDRALARRAYFNSELKFTLWENVSDVTQPSNSLLPHVRTDIAEYKRGNDAKLLRALFNQYYHPAERVYARASVGIYEEMYAGTGGQVLYLAKDGGWAADVALDVLRQRDFKGWFGFRDYDTVTAIASLHYRMAHGLTGTLRAGRFLARDEGVRMEVKRRFNSGFEVGAWYTVTNGNDITSPGTPESPYHDKGIFMRMALNAMLTRDTAVTANMSLTPWTRDVGQMVVSPGDLARQVERSVVQMHARDGLSGLGDMEDDYELPSLGTGARDRPWPDFVPEDARALGRAAAGADWKEAALLGAGLVLVSSAADRGILRYAERHKDERWLERGVKWGDALPVVAAGLSGVFALDDSRPRLQDAGIAALEASALAVAGTEVLKRAVGRARPDTGLGNAEFDSFTSERDFHSFPSRHAAVMWAAVTPYAKEFGMPWLYGLAAITNAARAASREHWVSDTVAGSLIGYWLGSLAWEARRDARSARNAPKVAVGLDNVSVAWEF
jgi:membrane-associated phospholipid phosphatase